MGGSYLVLAGATLTFGNDNVTTTSLALPSRLYRRPAQLGRDLRRHGPGQQRQRTGLGRREPFRWPRLLQRHGLREPHGGLQRRCTVRHFVDLHDTRRQSSPATLPTPPGAEATDNDGGSEPSTISSILLAPPCQPAVSAVAPATGPITGGTTVTITGLGTGKRHGGRFRRDGRDHRQRHQHHHRGHQPCRQWRREAST